METLSPSTPPTTRRFRGLLWGLVALVLLTGAFLLGRRTSPPEVGATEVSAGDREADAAKSHASPGEDKHEAGVVRFTPLALSRAGLRVEPVVLTPLRADLQVTGTVEPNIAGLVQVTPRVAGKITSIQATIGAPVRTGQVLATMTSTELASAQAQYRQAGARVSAAEANLRRQRQLAGFGEFGQHKIQEAQGTFSAAQGDVNEAQAEVRAAQNEIAEAEAAQVATQSEAESARSDVTAAEAALGQTKSQVEVMRSRFQRQEALLKEELTSRQDWEQARADLQKAESDVSSAEAALHSSHAKVSAAVAKIKQATSVIGSQRAKLRQAQAKLGATRQHLSLGRQALTREEKIYKSGVLSSKEVAEAAATLRQAQLERSTATDTVRLLGGRPGDGNTLSITAPIGGRVTQRPVSIGETVSPDKSVFTVLNLNTVWVQLNVYQRDLPAIRIGQPVTLTTEAGPGQRFTGTVTYIGDGVDETTRTVKVRCVIPNRRGLLRPDMFVRGRIATAANTHGISLPKNALQALEGKTVVFAQGEHPGEFRPKEVKTGGTSNGRTLIVAGLTPGERVVTEGAFTVKAQAMKSELTEE